MNQQAQAVPHGDEYTKKRTISTGTVSELVGKHPGSTSRELSEFSSLCRLTIARRLTEASRLKKGPLVRKGNARACRITGNMAITWWPQDK